MVLPLRLVPFEHYMLTDDRPAYPMNCFVRLGFSGRFDRARLDRAARAALARHPLLSAMVRPAAFGRWKWVSADAPSIMVEWLEASDLTPYPQAQRLDVRCRSGLQLRVVENGDQCVLVAQFHHACADGLGVCRFLEDLLVLYARESGVSPHAAELRSLTVTQLRWRGRFGLSVSKIPAMLAKQLIGLTGVWKFSMHRPVPLASPLPGATVALPSSYPAALRHEMDRAESTALRTAARRHAVTLNDLLARDLFLAISAWRAGQGQSSQDWLRLSIPVNLRTESDHSLPAANVVSMIFLDRRAGDFSDPQRLLSGIHDEMQLIKRNRLGLTFIGALCLLGMMPGGLARVARGDRCSTTCVLSNLGQPLSDARLPRQDGRLVAGSVTLESIELLPPLRPYTAAALTIQLYAERLAITMHYDLRSLTPTQAQDIFDRLLERLHGSAAGGTP